jgi:hypothetical protein
MTLGVFNLFVTDVHLVMILIVARKQATMLFPNDASERASAGLKTSIPLV